MSSGSAFQILIELGGNVSKSQFWWLATKALLSGLIDGR